MKYRKKPVVIEARQWDGTDRAADDIVDWILGEGETAYYYPHQRFIEHVQPAQGAHIVIETMEGPIHASPGDYIIRGVGSRRAVSLPSAGSQGLDAMTVGASDDAAVAFDLLKHGPEGAKGGYVPRLPVHVVEVQGHRVLAVTTVDAARLKLVGVDAGLQFTVPIDRLGVHLLAVALTLQAPPVPGGSLLGSRGDSGWTRPAVTEGGAEAGISAPGDEGVPTLTADEVNAHPVIIPDFYPCKPDIFEATYEDVE